MSAFLQETVTLPALATKREVADCLRCSVRKVERLLEARELVGLGGGKIGGSPVLILVASVNRYLARLLGDDALLERPSADLTPTSAAPVATGLPVGPLVPTPRERVDRSKQ